MSLFANKSCFIIVGASKGLGKSIAINFAKQANPDSTFLLLSRDTKALEAVKTEINSSCPKVKVILQQFDQAKLDGNKADQLFKTVLPLEGVNQAVIVHNAGTLGDNSKYTRDLTSVEELNIYFSTNVTGTILLNAAFLKFFDHEKFPNRYVINISSLTAVEAFKSFSFYCTGKAARDMFFRVVAAEESSVRVLNYAPGPCATDMQVQCRENSVDPEVKQIFQSMHDEGKILECDTSIKKLIQLLENDKFISGAHIDFFDI